MSKERFLTNNILFKFNPKVFKTKAVNKIPGVAKICH